MKKIIVFWILCILFSSIVIAQETKLYNAKDVELIMQDVKIDQFLQNELIVENDNPDDWNIVVSSSGSIVDSIVFDDTNYVVPARSEVSIPFKLKGNKDLGFYEGEIQLNGDFSRDIPVLMQVYHRSFLPIQALVLDSEVLSKIAFPGNSFRFNIDVQNRLNYFNYTVDLGYKIQKKNETDIYMSEAFRFNLTKKETFTRDLTLPKNLTKGEYAFTVDVNFLNFTTRSDTIFLVKIKWYNYKVFGVIPVWIILAIIGFILGSWGLYKWIIYMRNRKRQFLVDIDYDTLPGGGTRDLFMGNIAEEQTKAFIDMDKLTVHGIIAGSTGGGKSIAAQDVVEEALLKNSAVIVFDPTAQWTGMLKKCEDSGMLKHYPNFGMKSKDARGFRGNIRHIKHGRQQVDLFKNIVPGEVQIFVTNTLEPKDYDTFVANTIRAIFKNKNKESRELDILLVYDEIHRILPKFGGSGDGFIQIERACREFRKWGIGLLLISQVLQDFVGEIRANINTQIQMKTRDENDLNNILTNYGEDYIHKLVKAPVGTGMIQNAAWNRGVPYFITFRPILHSVERVSDEIIEMYNEFNEIIDDYDDQLGELTNLGQDVTDIQIELKLVKDKLQSGNYKIIKIYLDELTPRFETLWKNLGMEAPQRAGVQLVDEGSLKDELEKAKKLREGYQKEEKPNPFAKLAQKKTEEKKPDNEVLNANWNSLVELKKQIEDAAQRDENDRVKELISEAVNLSVAEDKKVEKQKIIDDLNLLLAS